MTAGEVQQFATAPQAVGSRKGKYREADDSTRNMMYDRRVVRGNTYASLITPQQDMAEVQKQREAQRRRLMRANQAKKRTGTPEPTPGRRHMDIQTDSYLEELTERTVEFEAETQTDFLLDRPPSPLFMPAKIGMDMETQIEEGELFDFDVEVEPVLEVLVGKTLEQSMMEVLEEEELESLRRHQEDFEQRRNVQLLEVQRMEAAEKRRADEMERRMNQQAAQRERDLSTMRKVVSRTIASAHLSSLRDRALAHLLDAGVFADNVQLAVETNFVPQLVQIVGVQMDRKTKDRQAASTFMQTVLQSRLDRHEAILQAERDRLKAISDAIRQARIEQEQERQRREQERQRITNEQRALLEWEAYQPPPPPQPEQVEVHIASLEDGVAVLADETRVPVDPEKVQELTDMLASVEPPNVVLAKLQLPLPPPPKEDAEDGAADTAEPPAPPADGADGAPEAPEGPIFVGDFYIGEPPPPRDPDAEAAADDAAADPPADSAT